MAEPSGKIVARPMVARACGCMQEFQHYTVDKYRAQRLAKFQKTRCPACVIKFNEEQMKAAQSLPKKGEALHLLPPGTQIFLTRKTDGLWAGSLKADNQTIEFVAELGGGPQAVVVALARKWAAAVKPTK